jgi:ATP-dependent protease ClpP protease subunit
MRNLTAVLCAALFTTASFATTEATNKLGITLSATSEPAKHVQLTPGNVISIVGPISAQTEATFAKELFSKDFDDVYVFLDSPGGSIIAGNGIISAMKSSGKKVTCIAKFAASMAFVILQSCDNRYVTEDSIIMQHVASYGLRGQAPNNVSFLNFLEKMTKTIDERQAARIGLSYVDFKKVTRDDLWLFGSDAIDFGAADATVNVTCSARLVKSRKKVTVRSMFGSSTFTFSGCPLVGAPLPNVKKDADSIKAYNRIGM